MARVADLDDDALRAKIVSTIINGELLGVRAYTEEEPEDVVVPLLDPSSPRREPVLAGCRDLCARLLSLVNDPQTASAPETAVAIAHFAGLMGATRPSELRQQIRSLLEMALAPSVPGSVRDPIVSLAVDYANDEADAAYWQRHLEGNVIPGQAFQALLQIDPQNPRVERSLIDLWIRALREGMSIKTPFAVQRWASLQEDADTAIQRLIQKVLQVAPELRASLEADCMRYRHSKQWMVFVARQVQPPQLVRFQAKSRKVDRRGEIALVGSDFWGDRVEGSQWITTPLDAPQSAEIMRWYDRDSISLRNSLERDLSIAPVAHLTKVKISPAHRDARTLHRLVLSHENATLEYELWIDTALKTFAGNLVMQLEDFRPQQDILKKA